MNLFHSARLKLTAFYFGVLVIFCLLLTFGVHAVTDRELDRGNTAQRGIAHRIFQQYFDQSDTPPPSDTPYGDQYFANNQAKQATVTRARLNRDIFWMDVGVLAVGAVVSYWYAGRTLKPIEEMHEQQKRFTSDASHELRTPLASMRLENELFLRQKNFSETEARGLIASNLEEVDRLEKLATNLLALNDYEHSAISHAPVPIQGIVDDAVARFKKQEAAKKVTFASTIVPATVDVNRESMVELVAILLDNAVKYGPKNGTVEIGGAMDGEAYVLTVRDHGPGIPDTDLPHIFERMFRGDKARSSKVSGHGLGLSLAQQIATANDAEITAENAPAGGAVFSVHFN